MSKQRAVPLALLTFILGIVVGAYLGRASINCGSASEVVSPVVPAVEYYYGRYYGEIAVEMWNRSLERKAKMTCPITPSERDPRMMFCLKLIIVFILRRLISILFTILASLGSKLVLLGKGAKKLKKLFARGRRVNPPNQNNNPLLYRKKQPKVRTVRRVVRRDGAAPSSSSCQ